MHGSADTVVPSVLTTNFADRISYKDKKVIIYKGTVHRAFDDTNRDEVLDDLILWLNGHNQE